MTPTINLNINYLLPGNREDVLLVTAKADRIGRHLANIHTECRSEKTGKLLASAMVNFYASERLRKRRIKSHHQRSHREIGDGFLLYQRGIKQGCRMEYKKIVIPQKFLENTCYYFNVMIN